MKYKFKDTALGAPKFGAHYIRGKTYEPGDVIDTPFDLAAAFPEKFERIDSDDESSPPSTKGPAGAEELEQLEAPATITSEEDVTEEFPLAKELGVYVVRRDADGKYAVVHPEQGLLSDLLSTPRTVNLFLQRKVNK